MHMWAVMMKEQKCTCFVITTILDTKENNNITEGTLYRITLRNISMI